jgi:hypothetical protein
MAGDTAADSNCIFDPVRPMYGPCTFAWQWIMAKDYGKGLWQRIIDSDYGFRTAPSVM